MTCALRFTLLGLLAACTTTATTTSTTTTATGGPPAPAALTNTSLTTALPLAAGTSFDLTLPCGVKAYFGPIKFSAEGQRIALVTRVRSPSGKQVCGGGAFVDQGEVQQAGAGTGCIDGAHEYAANVEYVYTPGSGGSGANPLYLTAWTSNGISDPAAADCDVLALHVDVKAAP